MYYNKYKYDACIITNKYDISFVKALESILSQNVQPEWIYVIDDHSKEDIEKSKMHIKLLQQKVKIEQ